MRISDWSSDVCSSDLGPGVGGHCIAVDPWFIVHGDPENARLIRTAREVNDAKVDHVFENASRMIDGMPGAEIACLGLAFKANIDDFRESPALKIASRLARRYGSRVKLVEPHRSAEHKSEIKSLMRN